MEEDPAAASALGTYIEGTLSINEPTSVPTQRVTVMGWSIYGAGGVLVVASEGHVSWDDGVGGNILFIKPRSHDQSFTRDRRLAVNGYVYEHPRDPALTWFIANLELDAVVPPPPAGP